MTSGPPPRPRLTNRGFEVNPSPQEIAIGAIEQYRRSKLSKAWKNVLVSLVKGDGGGIGSLCIWRDSIGHDGSNYLELLQQVSLRDMQNVREEAGVFRISLYYSPEEPLTFRCRDEPAAVMDWVTTLRTVLQHVHNPTVSAPVRPAPQRAPAKKPDVNLMSFDVSQTQSTPDLLIGGSGGGYPQRPKQHQQQPMNYQGYPPNGFHSHPQQPVYAAGQPNYGAYQQQSYAQQQQQKPANAYPFSQPPPLPFAIQRKSGFPVQQTNATAFNSQPPRSLTPPPQQTYGMPARSTSPIRSVSNNVPLANQFPQPVPRPTKPQPAKTPPRRSFSAPQSPANRRQTTKVPVATGNFQEDLKKYVFTTWALQPPNNSNLKPLIELVRCIHQVFPPQLKMVAPHDYFGKWKPVTPGEYHQPGGLDKIIRRLRFFLHPDKLPSDFTEHQSYLCKLLWDIINDAQQQQQGSK